MVENIVDFKICGEKAASQKLCRCSAAVNVIHI